jgi:thiol-disulfide isomerase/thioredoxin
VNYWAAWCKPCLKEIPEFNKISLLTDVEVLAFNYDELAKPSLEEQVSNFDIRYDSLLNDPSGLFKQGKPTGLPATMVINSEGKFVKWLYGAQTKESLMKVLSISHF